MRFRATGRASPAAGASAVPSLTKAPCSPGPAPRPAPSRCRSNDPSFHARCTGKPFRLPATPHARLLTGRGRLVCGSSARRDRPLSKMKCRMPTSEGRASQEVMFKCRRGPRQPAVRSVKTGGRVCMRSAPHEIVCGGHGRKPPGCGDWRRRGLGSPGTLAPLPLRAACRPAGRPRSARR